MGLGTARWDVSHIKQSNVSYKMLLKTSTALKSYNALLVMTLKMLCRMIKLNHFAGEHSNSPTTRRDTSAFSTPPNNPLSVVTIHVYSPLSLELTFVKVNNGP